MAAMSVAATMEEDYVTERWQATATISSGRLIYDLLHLNDRWILLGSTLIPRSWMGPREILWMVGSSESRPSR